MSTTVEEPVFSFDAFDLFPARRLLLKDGRPVKLGNRALDLLVALVENAGQVVAKTELFTRVWSTVTVEDTNLRVHICGLRRVLGDDGLEHRYIVHVGRRGYAFVGFMQDPGLRASEQGSRHAYGRGH